MDKRRSAVLKSYNYTNYNGRSTSNFGVKDRFNTLDNIKELIFDNIYYTLYKSY